MVSVRPISELSVAPNGCFAFVGPCSSLSIQYVYPGGVGENNNFQAFSHELGTIIRFEEIPQSGNTAWSMTAVLDTGEEYLLQLPVYEENFDFWENKPLRAHEFLGFLNSVEMLDDPSRPVDVGGRCDRGMYGPRIYYPSDGIKPTPLDFSLLSKSFTSLMPMLNINGVAHLTSQYVDGIDMSWRNWPLVTLTARTLSGMLRQLCEWRELYMLGIASEDYAQDAALFIDSLGITEEMINELKQSEVPMPTERFIRGYGNPRHGFSETGILPTSIKNHLKQKLFYRNLSTLSANHPLHPDIDASLKKQEKDLHQKNVLLFASRRMPQVAIKDITPEKIYDCCYMRNEFSGIGMMAPLQIDIQVVGNGMKAARFFDAIS